MRLGEMEKGKEFFTKNIHVVLLATLCTFLWGSALPGVKIGFELFSVQPQDTYTKMLFAGARFFLSGLITITAASVISKKLVLPVRKSIGDIALVGFVLTVAQYFFYYLGLYKTPGVKGAILNATGTFVAVLAAHFLYKNDRINRAKALGCTVGFFGVVLINLGQGEITGGFAWDGEGFMIVASMAFGVGSVLSKRAADRWDSMTVTGYQLLFGGAILAIIGLFGGGRLEPSGFWAMVLFFYLAALSAVAFTVWTLLLKYNSVGKILVFNFLVPIFGALLSGIVLGENIFEWRTAAALCLVCIGIFIVNRPKKDQGLPSIKK
ncbi:MAG: DMT family transporter [Christensenellales bacterium]